MSVFRVDLNNTSQGLLDQNPLTGAQFTNSIQRTIYVTGPGRTYRKLKDGDTFTDCNYWKRFAYPQVALDQAFITVVTDDGSVYSDVASENTYPKVYDITASGGSTYSDNVADIFTDTGGYANFVQITNASSSQAVRIKLNGLSTAMFDLGTSETQVFNAGDLQVSKIEIDNSTSGAVSAAVQILLSVRSVCNS